MNERINALLIEAHRQTEGGIYNRHLSVWTEKFAELIVRECIKQARKDENGLAYEAVARIAEHFGIE